MVMCKCRLIGFFFKVVSLVVCARHCKSNQVCFPSNSVDIISVRYHATSWMLMTGQEFYNFLIFLVAWSIPRFFFTLNLDNEKHSKEDYIFLVMCSKWDLTYILNFSYIILEILIYIYRFFSLTLSQIY